MRNIAMDTLGWLPSNTEIGFHPYTIENKPVRNMSPPFCEWYSPRPRRFSIFATNLALGV